MEESHSNWRIDRTITIPALLSVISTMTVGIALAVSLDIRLEAVETKVATIRNDVTEARETAIRVARIDERIAAMQQILGEIKADIRERRKQ